MVAVLAGCLGLAGGRCEGMTTRTPAGSDPAALDGGRVAADLAGAWLLKSPGERRTVARMLRHAGITWVRERLRWSEVEPEPGRFVWGKYDETATILAEEGLHICQVWHDTPAWARPGNPDGSAPDDLRAVYRFAREAARHFRGRIQAWEIWNEPDIFFWKDPADRYAGFLAAAALGIRAGDPGALVLHGSLCSGVGPFARGVAAAGTMDFCDVFNWHLYKAPRDYPGDLTAYRTHFTAAGAPWRPAWMTESGIRLAGSEGEGRRLLGPEDRQVQARFVPRSVVMSLAAGTARHFFFVVPDYTEKGTQYGVLRPDLTPTPAFEALGVAARQVGDAAYLGRLDAGAAEVRVFRSTRGLVAVGWSDHPAEVVLPAAGDGLEVTDQQGHTHRVPVAGSAGRVMLGPDAVYVGGVASAVVDRLTDRPPASPPLPPPRTAALVLAARSALPVDKDRDARTLDGSATTFIHEIEVCRFGAAAPGRGEIRLALPAGWTADRTAAPFDLEDGGRVLLPFRLTPAGGSLAPARVRAVAVGADGAEAAAVESRFLLDTAALEEGTSRPLPWEDPARWHRSPGSGAGELTVTRTGGTGLRFTGVRTPGVAGWWEIELDPALLPELATVDAVACTMWLASGGADDTHVFLMLVEAGGTVRMTGGAVEPTPHAGRFLLRDMGFEGAGRPVAVRLGVWTGGALPMFDCDGFRLVQLRPRKPPVQ